MYLIDPDSTNFQLDRSPNSRNAYLQSNSQSTSRSTSFQPQTITTSVQSRSVMQRYFPKRRKLILGPPYLVPSQNLNSSASNIATTLGSSANHNCPRTNAHEDIKMQQKLLSFQLQRQTPSTSYFIRNQNLFSATSAKCASQPMQM